METRQKNVLGRPVGGHAFLDWNDGVVGTTSESGAGAALDDVVLQLDGGPRSRRPVRHRQKRGGPLLDAVVSGSWDHTAIAADGSSTSPLPLNGTTSGGGSEGIGDGCSSVPDSLDLPARPVSGTHFKRYLPAEPPETPEPMLRVEGVTLRVDSWTGYGVSPLVPSLLRLLRL